MTVHRDHMVIVRTLACRGFTLLEMMVVLTIIAVVATMALPQLTADSVLRLSSTARILRSDIELAQVLTIAHPDDPVAVVFDTAQSRYWLAYETDTSTPMPHPQTGDPYLVQLGAGRGAQATEMTIEIADISGGVLRFNAQGGLDDFSLNPVIALVRDDRWVTLGIAPTTGTIAEAEGEGTPP